MSGWTTFIRLVCWVCLYPMWRYRLMRAYTRGQSDPANWSKTKDDRVRPEGMTRRQWRSLGGERRRAVITGMWAALNPESPEVPTAPKVYTEGAND